MFCKLCKTCSIAAVRYRHDRERHGLIVLINLFEEQKKKTFGEFLKGKFRFHEHTTKCELDEQYCGQQQQESVVSNTEQLPYRVESNTSFLVLRPIYSHPREG